MPTIILEKRYPHIADEDVTEIFNAGYLQGWKNARRKAIPVTWIRNYASHKASNDFIDCYWHFWEEDVLKMIDVWEKENEQKTSD